MKTLPHKQLVVSAGIALAIFIVGFFSNYQPRATPNETSRITTKVLPPLANTDIDTDKDGLPDWKEKLYGTDMHKVDTDGDGTNDGDEITAGRNPLIANTAKKGAVPNDTISYLQDTSVASSTTDVGSAKKEYFARVLADRGKQIKEDSLQNLVKQDINPDVFKPTGQLVSLNITSDNSEESVRKYINSFGQLIKRKYSGNTYRTEEAVVDEAITTKNPRVLQELQMPAITYKNFSKDLTALEVPSVLANANLLIANGYEGMAKGILGMESIFAKPTVGFAGYEAYTKYRFDVTQGYAMIVSYVGINKMTFGKDESGYMFYWNTVANNYKAPLIQKISS